MKTTKRITVTLVLTVVMALMGYALEQGLGDAAVIGVAQNPDGSGSDLLHRLQHF